jgi:hypothetical protein
MAAVQFSALGSSPGDALPILTRWRRILRTSAGSVMIAMRFISDPHRGQSKGSTSQTFAISRAQAELQAACDTVVGSVVLACAGHRLRVGLPPPLGGDTRDVGPALPPCLAS